MERGSALELQDAVATQPKFWGLQLAAQSARRPNWVRLVWFTLLQRLSRLEWG